MDQLSEGKQNLSPKDSFRDLVEMFAPVAQLSLVLVRLTIKVYQIDFGTAYLKGEIE